jgi:hypothetical protein
MLTTGRKTQRFSLWMKAAMILLLFSFFLGDCVSQVE